MSSQVQNHIEKIFKNQSHINVDLILGYLDNKLAPEKKHLVEKALLNDPFLSDALDGLNTLSHEDRNRIVFELLGKEQKEPVVIPYRLIGIAAATIIGISTIFLITRSLLSTTATSETLAHQEVREVSKKKSETPQELPALRPSESQVLEESKESESIAGVISEEDANEPEKELEVKIQEPAALAEKPKPIAVAMSPNKSIAFDSVKSDEFAYQEVVSRGGNEDIQFSEEVVSKAKKEVTQKTPQQIALSMIPTLKSKIVSSNYTVVGAISRAQGMDKVEIESLSKKEAEAMDNYIQGITAFNKGDFKEALNKLETAYKKDNSLGDVKFYLTATYLCGDGNISKAKKVFVPENTQTFTQEKQWIQSVIYLNEGKVDVAKMQLEKLSETSSYFQAEAEQILEQLK